MIIKIITVTFLEDVALEIGDIPMDDVRTDLLDVEDVAEAAYLIESHGLSFEATGNVWAGDPDGSQIVDYATATRIEVSAHFGDGWTDADMGAVMDLVR